MSALIGCTVATTPAGGESGSPANGASQSSVAAPSSPASDNLEPEPATSVTSAPSVAVSGEPSSAASGETTGHLPEFPGPTTLETANGGVEASDVRSCPTVFYQGRASGADQCGAYAVDLDAPSTHVSPGADVVLVPPAAYRFSFGRAGEESDLPAPPGYAWAVRVAPVEALAGLGESTMPGIPLTGSRRELGRSSDPTGKIRIQAPTAPGEYMLELSFALTRGDWTYIGLQEFWRLSIH